MEGKEKDYPDAKTMDGPVVKYAVSDLFRNHPKLFMVYHVMATPFDLFCTSGVVLGGFLSWAAPFIRRRFPSTLAVMGTSGLVVGCTGMVLGLTALAATAQRGDTNEPIPWNEAGIQQRVDGLSHNFKVRLLDDCAGMGMGIAATTLWAAGGPGPLGLSSAPRMMSLGILQGLCLGSALGGLGAMGLIYSTLPKKTDDETDDDE